MIQPYLDDILVTAGMVLIVYGFYRVWPESVWFAAGVALIALGVLYGWSTGRHK